MTASNFEKAARGRKAKTADIDSLSFELAADWFEPITIWLKLANTKTRQDIEKTVCSKT
jgi:hypothetical protein